jgi:uncharacterized protein (TIGR02453 family)
MPHFTREFFDFFAELEENNERDWFNANKKRYEAHVKQPCLDFISDFAPLLEDLSPHYEAIPKAVGGSMFRIYRDVRFSKDKRPYKTAAGLMFKHVGGKHVVAPGFYLHMTAGEVAAGAGMWMPPNPVLAKIRTAIDQRSDEWGEIKAALTARGGRWHGADKALKRVPRGFDPDHVHGDDLKLKTVAVGIPMSESDALTDNFVERFAAACDELLPFVRFLGQAVGVEV